jgi:hypothetical protein
MNTDNRFPSSYGDVSGDEFCKSLKKSLQKKKGIRTVIMHRANQYGVMEVALRYASSREKLMCID